MNSAFIRLLALVLVISSGPKTGFAAGQISLSKSNSAAGPDLGMGASRIVRPEIRLLADGAVADYGLQKVYFPAEITEAPLTIITAGGRKLACRATFLAANDAASGKSLLLGQVTNSIGILVGDNTIIYPRAFGVLGDLRFRYTKYSLEQDILLNEAVQLPAGLQPENVTLEVWSEWFDSTPDTKEAQELDLRPLAATEKQVGVAASDERLQWGASRIGEGFAFGMQSEREKTPVAKTFGRIEGRDWLIERVDYTALKPLLDKLPKPQAGLTPENLKPDRAELIRSLPAQTRVKAAGKLMRLAKAEPENRNRVVLDFVIVSSVPVPAGVVSWWPAGGNANDAIAASGNHGSWLGTATYGAGKVGQAFSLGGVNNAVTVADAASLNFGDAQNFTLETWIKPLTNANPSGLMSILGKRQTDGLGYELYLTNGALGVRLGDAAYNSANFVVAGNLRDGALHHVAVTVDRSVTNGLKLYVDGVATAFDPTGCPGDLSNAEPLRLGVYPNGGTNCFFKGIIDEPALYARALSESEIQGLYGAGVAGKNNPNCLVAPANLVAWWPGDGSTNDLAGTNIATLSGATYESAVASQGFSFDGSNDGVTAANDNALNLATTNDSVTLEAWVKPLANTTTYGVMSVVGKRYSPNSYTATGYELYLVNGVPGFQIANGTSYANFSATGDLRDGGYHHLVVTMDRSIVNGGHIYVDGVAKLDFNPRVLTATLSNAAPVRIGVHPQSGFNGWYKGVIDEVGIYRRALDSTEVSQLYVAGGAGKCKDDLDYDGLPDWWELRHFGNLDQVGSSNQGDNWDYDGDGVSNLAEFNAGTDPNTIVFDVQFNNLRVNGNTANGTFNVLKGVPDQMAVLLDSTNFASATWVAYNSNFSVSVGSTDGPHDVWIGLKGRADTSEATWGDWPLTRDTVAPLIVITNPAVTTVSQPFLQLQGYSPEPLSGLRYDLTNAAGSLTNEQGFVSQQWFDTNLFELTTNWFECVDIPLTNGDNTITLRATDGAGNVTTNVYTYVLDYGGDTTPPALTVYWPQDGTQVSGTNFTLRGWLDDATATVSAQIVGTNGVTNVVSGLLERDGLLWVPDLPLGGGTNTLTLTMTDAADNTNVTSLSVVQSAVLLTIDDLSGVDVNQPRITVYGTINVSDHKIWVNGMEVTNVSAGSWYVDGVPVNAGGTSVIQAEAIPNTDYGGNGTGGSGGSGATMQDSGNPASPEGKKVETGSDKPPEIVTIHYHKKWHYEYVELPPSTFTSTRTADIKWDLNSAGYWKSDECSGDTYDDDFYYEWNQRLWDEFDVGIEQSDEHRGYRGVVCGVRDLHIDDYPYTPPGWPGESCKGSQPRRSLDTKETVSRDTRTLYVLHTGGKKRPGRKNLFVLSASATGIANMFYPEPDNDEVHMMSYPITNNAIVLGDLGQLGSDGVLYKALGDGETRKVTPTVQGSRYYTYGPPALNLITLNSLTVVSNSATTVVATHWAAVKTNTGAVIIEATLSTDDTNAANFIEWTGGVTVPGHPFQRQVSKADSAKTTVTASLGTNNLGLTVWILWSTVTIQTSDTTPTNAVQFGTAYDGTENLGGQIYTDAGQVVGVGKVVPIAQLTPSGLHDLITNGWAFKRERIGRVFIDGTTYLYETAWTNDTSFPQYQVLIPDSNDRIYDRDAPNIERFGATSCSEKYGIFRQWIEWNGTPASEQFSAGSQWHHFGKWKVGASPPVIQNEVGGGHSGFPGSPAGCP